MPVSSFDACDIDAETLALLHCNHLRCRLKAELLHHRFEVVLTRALRRENVHELRPQDSCLDGKKSSSHSTRGIELVYTEE